MKRREFLKVSALSAAGTAVLAGCATPQRRIESRVVRPEANPVDEEVWYNTACAGCTSGCGIMVRVIDGRAKKIEGNPDHPVSRGKLCARGQMGLQFLYHPDRVKDPLRRAGEKGSNDALQRTDWDGAIAEVARRLNEAAARGDGAVLVFTGQTNGHTGLLLDRFARAVRAPGRFPLESLPQTALVRANRNAFGVEALAEYDLDHADFVLSFGAHLFEGGPSAVRYNRGYGEMRQGRSTVIGRMVHVEPRLSLTAANADRWVAVHPGMEGAFALGVLHALANANQPRPQGAPDLSAWRGPLAEYTPQRVSEITGAPREVIEEVARDFAAARAPLAIPGEVVAGYTNGVAAATAINALNVAANNLGREGGVRFPPQLPLRDTLVISPLAYNDLRGHVERMRNGQVAAVLIYDTNPAYGLPAALGFAEALARVPFVLSFASFLDETTQYADFVLPDVSFLERFDTRVPIGTTNQAVLTTAQPVVEPFLPNTRPMPDVLLAIARAMGGGVASAMPTGSFADFVKETAVELQRANAGSVRGGSPDEVWRQMLQKGGWWSDPGQDPAARVDQAAVQGSLRFEPPRFEGDAGTFPFVLQVYESNSLGAGRFALLPWAQELPDPLTTAVWSSWVEINPETAQRLGLRTGDLVEVESPAGKVQVAAYLYPGIAPGMVAMPLGQGHTARSQWAAQRGANPLAILAPAVDPAAGALAYGATRVKVTKVAGPGRLVVIEGRSPLPGRAFFEGEG